jgi:hypothetical protein
MQRQRAWWILSISGQSSHFCARNKQKIFFSGRIKKVHIHKPMETEIDPKPVFLIDQLRVPQWYICTERKNKQFVLTTTKYKNLHAFFCYYSLLITVLIVNKRPFIIYIVSNSRILPFY